MASNQPVPPIQVVPQSTPTAAVRFLFHTIGALVAGVIVAIVVTLFNYTATDGQSVDIRTVLIAAGFSALGFLGAFIRTDVKPNQAQLLQGLSDLLQATHQPIFTYLSQLFATQQQIVQAVQAAPTPQAAPLPPAQPVANTTTIPQFDMTQPSGTWASPISQMPTNVEMPAVITSQPWQPPASGVFEDTGPMPVVSK